MRDENRSCGACAAKQRLGAGMRGGRPGVRAMNQFSRTELLLGAEGMAKLAASRIAIFGVGGVGGYAAEALVRSGLGAIDLFDDDRICLTKLNRLIIAGEIVRELTGQKS